MTLNAPSVITLVPVAVLPDVGVRLAEKAPAAVVDVSVVIVMLPLPPKIVDHPAVEQFDEPREAFATLPGPSV